MKKTLLFTWIWILILVPSLMAKEALPSSQPMTLDGDAVNIGAYLIEEAHYFKIRDLAALFTGTPSQFNVTYDRKNAAVSITKGEAYTPLPTDLKPLPKGMAQGDLSPLTIFVDGKKVQLSAYLIRQNNYVKLRDLADAVGFAVDWNTATKTVELRSTSAKIQPQLLIYTGKDKESMALKKLLHQFQVSYEEYPYSDPYYVAFIERENLLDGTPVVAGRFDMKAFDSSYSRDLKIFLANEGFIPPQITSCAERYETLLSVGDEKTWEAAFEETLYKKISQNRHLRNETQITSKDGIPQPIQGFTGVLSFPVEEENTFRDQEDTFAEQSFPIASYELVPEFVVEVPKELPFTPLDALDGIAPRVYDEDQNALSIGHHPWQGFLFYNADFNLWITYDTGFILRYHIRNVGEKAPSEEDYQTLSIINENFLFLIDNFPQVSLDKDIYVDLILTIDGEEEGQHYGYILKR